MHQAGRRSAVKVRQDCSGGIEANTTGGKPAAGCRGVKWVVAAGGILCDLDLETAFEAFHRGGADARVEMHPGDNHAVTVQPVKGRGQFGFGESVKAGLVDNGLARKRL